MLDTFINEFKMGEKVPPAQFSPLTLAYVGDCVYELFVRTYLLKDTNLPVQKLHKSAIKMVNAKAQSDLYQKVKDSLTDEETAVYKRGRNTNSHPPKNANMVDYKSATGMEALIGYLYLKGESERILEILKNLID
ncbi:MAG: ribonuclease III domain-containing protein [Clostridia bacterium]|nr:ribonuclease III domain-containing protein [Clostridia bacterium]